MSLNRLLVAVYVENLRVLAAEEHGMLLALERLRDRRKTLLELINNEVEESR